MNNFFIGIIILFLSGIVTAFLPNKLKIKMTSLFSFIAKNVAEELGYVYNSEEEKACIDFLNIVCELPKDAEEVV